MTHVATESIEWLERQVDFLSKRIARQIAWDQLSKHRFTTIAQAVLDIDEVIPPNWFPVIKNNSEEKSLLFAPITDSEILSLCSTMHTFIPDKGNPIQATLSVFEGFKEMEAACYQDCTRSKLTIAREVYAPLIQFPFLPFSRKFLLVKSQQGESIDLTKGSFEVNNELNHLRTYLLPNRRLFWNLDIIPKGFTNRTYIGSENGMFKFRPSDPTFTFLHSIEGPSGKIDDDNIEIGEGGYIKTRKKPKGITYTKIFQSMVYDHQQEHHVSFAPNEISGMHSYWGKHTSGLGVSLYDIESLLLACPVTAGTFNLDGKTVREDTPAQKTYLWPILENKGTRGSLNSVILHLKPKVNLPSYMVEAKAQYFASVCTYMTGASIPFIGEVV